MGTQKNHLIETLFSTHNICFGWEIGKIILKYAFLFPCLIHINIFSRPFKLFLGSLFQSCYPLLTLAKYTWHHPGFYTKLNVWGSLGLNFEYDGGPIIEIGGPIFLYKLRSLEGSTSFREGSVLSPGQ